MAGGGAAVLERHGNPRLWLSSPGEGLVERAHRRQCGERGPAVPESLLGPAQRLRVRSDHARQPRLAQEPDEHASPYPRPTSPPRGGCIRRGAERCPARLPGERGPHRVANHGDVPRGGRGPGNPACREVSDCSVFLAIVFNMIFSEVFLGLSKEGGMRPWERIRRWTALTRSQSAMQSLSVRLRACRIWSA